MKFAHVAFPIPEDLTFTYSIPNHLIPIAKAGCRVLASFGNSIREGVIVNLLDRSDVDNPDVGNPDLDNQDVGNPDVENQDVGMSDAANDSLQETEILSQGETIVSRS